MRTRIRDKKIVNKKSNDPLDIQIFEKGLRATRVIPDKNLGILIVVLNNGEILKVKLADYKSLKKASQAQLDRWEFIGRGIGIHWDELDEDLSIKGMIRDIAVNSLLHQLQDKGIKVIDAVIEKTIDGSYHVQGHDGKGNKLTVILNPEITLSPV